MSFFCIDTHEIAVLPAITISATIVARIYVESDAVALTWFTRLPRLIYLVISKSSALNAALIARFKNAKIMVPIEIYKIPLINAGIDFLNK